MSESKAETTKGFCVVALTRHLMQKYAIPQDAAYARLIRLELYTLLMDTETRLYLERNDDLCRYCDLELEEGQDALYRALNAE